MRLEVLLESDYHRGGVYIELRKQKTDVTSGHVFPGDAERLAYAICNLIEETIAADSSQLGGIDHD